MSSLCNPPGKNYLYYGIHDTYKSFIVCQVRVKPPLSPFGTCMHFLKHHFVVEKTSLHTQYIKIIYTVLISKINQYQTPSQPFKSQPPPMKVELSTLFAIFPLALSHLLGWGSIKNQSCILYLVERLIFITSFLIFSFIISLLWYTY